MHRSSYLLYFLRASFNRIEISPMAIANSTLDPSLLTVICVFVVVACNAILVEGHVVAQHPVREGKGTLLCCCFWPYAYVHGPLQRTKLLSPSQQIVLDLSSRLY